MYFLVSPHTHFLQREKGDSWRKGVSGSCCQDSHLVVASCLLLLLECKLSEGRDSSIIAFFPPVPRRGLNIYWINEGIFWLFFTLAFTWGNKPN